MVNQNKIQWQRGSVESCKTIELQTCLTPKLKRIEDYKERFDFYCVAHGVEEAKQKALFLMRIGQTAYSKLKTLVNPTPLAELDLNTIVEKLAEHYRPDTVEIAEQFKVFNHQLNDEGVT